MDLKLGGKYKMSKKLESGAFGEVFLAKELATGEEVAVKVESNRTRHPQLIWNSHLEKKRISKSKLAIAFWNKRKAKSWEGCIQDGSCWENWSWSICRCRSIYWICRMVTIDSTPGTIHFSFIFKIKYLIFGSICLINYNIVKSNCL